jgi:hypothetical protein
METPQEPGNVPPARRDGLLRRTIRGGGVVLWVMWSALSAALIAAAWVAWAPRYESTAWLEVKPSARPIFGASVTPDDPAALLDTQAQLIKSSDVLGAAALDPAVRALPRIATAPDPEAEIRRGLRVEVVPRTRLIQVTTSSRSPNEPTTILNAVVRHYLRSAEVWTDREALARIEQLRMAKNELGADIRRQREKLADLLTKQSRDMQLNREDRYRVALEEYQRIKRELVDNELAQIKAETRVKIMRERLNKGRPNDPAFNEKIDELVTEVETCRATDKALTQRLAALAIDSREEGSEALEIAFAKADLNNSRTMLLAVEKSLQQLDFEQRGGARVQLVSPASASPALVSDGWRLAAPFVIPILALPLVVALFLIVQVRAEQIAAAMRPEPGPP